jgi:hypothetical protein
MTLRENRLRVLTIVSVILIFLGALEWDHLENFLLSRVLAAGVSGLNRPVSLYGRVIDQDGEPVGGVRIEAKLQLYTRIAPYSMNLVTNTAKDGTFHIGGYRGDVLTLTSLIKGGYSEVRGQWQFVFGRGRIPPDTSSPQSPKVLRMWKSGVTEPLIAYDAQQNVIPDGTIYTVDLLEGTWEKGRMQNGDLWVSVTLPRDFRSGPFSGSYKIEVIDGGLVASDDPFMYRAPSDGYEKTLIHSGPGRSGLPDRYYVRSRGGGVFASLLVSTFQGDDHLATLRIQSSANANGSKNLEPDPLKLKRVPHH